MRTEHLLRIMTAIVSIVGLAMPETAIADGTLQPEIATQVDVIIAEKLWCASWSQSPIDINIVAPSGSAGQPQAKVNYAHNLSSRTVPIAILGLRYGGLAASVSRFTSTAFNSNGNYFDDVVKREETDITISYRIYPGISVAMVHHQGSVSSFLTKSAVDLLGSNPTSQGNGWLVGLGADAPINPRLSLYGNIAYGPVSFNGERDLAQTTGSYEIVEFGLAYRRRLNPPTFGLDTLAAQIGYRSQAISYKAITFDSDNFGGIPIRIDRSQGRSVTNGLVVGISLLF